VSIYFLFRTSVFSLTSVRRSFPLSADSFRFGGWGARSVRCLSPSRSLTPFPSPCLPSTIFRISNPFLIASPLPSYPPVALFSTSTSVFFSRASGEWPLPLCSSLPAPSTLVIFPFPPSVPFYPLLGSMIRSLSGTSRLYRPSPLDFGILHLSRSPLSHKITSERRLLSP